MIGGIQCTTLQAFSPFSVGVFQRLSGSELAWSLFLMELSNPLLHLRSYFKVFLMSTLVPVDVKCIGCTVWKCHYLLSCLILGSANVQSCSQFSKSFLPFLIPMLKNQIVLWHCEPSTASLKDSGNNYAQTCLPHMYQVKSKYYSSNRKTTIFKLGEPNGRLALQETGQQERKTAKLVEVSPWLSK